MMPSKCLGTLHKQWGETWRLACACSPMRILYTQPLDALQIQMKESVGEGDQHLSSRFQFICSKNIV